ncbi:Metalloenzyme, LuxS/M16 peptidase-like protein [Schizophyllum amplum]|uniref:Alpha-MPP n=1 Tax=Schizophyllum amplum TaxID=97359 RepID=A0A550CMJ1_9AGAR|nr:Metalloenzyme, LuxS/M16 peptidase-like protein [Auriculariopsis ampla]
MHKARVIARRGNRASKGSKRCLQHLAPTPSVQLTTLPNKIRVATERTPGHFSSVGLYVDAGSRYETPDILGVSHFLDRMAFKSTKSRTEEEMAAAIHSLGSQILCSSTREALMYQSSHFHQGTPLAVSLIADTVCNPKLAEEEVEAQRDAAAYEIREISSKPEMILPEILHGVAYNHTGLGNSLLCPPERVEKITPDTLRRAMDLWYKPERMVVAGVGMQHEELVELVDKHFSSLKTAPLPPSQPSRSSQQVPQHLLSPHTPSVTKTLTRAASYLFPNSPSDAPSPQSSPASTYTGGHEYIHDTNTEFNHLYIAFEGGGINDEDIFALATMQVLLGGGGSFSAGGPGKGMYSRLYTHILNHFPQIDHCASFHHIYTDSSLFGLFASFVPASSGLRGGNTPGQILPHLVHQLSLLLYTAVPEKELERAKNQLKSSMMMALESRAVEVEDLGRQLLVGNRREPIEEMVEKIDRLTPSDIQRVATKVWGHGSGRKPTVVCMGHEQTGDWQSVFRKYSVSV